MNKYELRFEIRANDESRKIEGKAISFETESNDLGFIEVLHRGCITQEVLDSSDILFTVNHNPEKVVARYNARKSSNMNIELREDGVYFSMDAPHTTLGNDVLEDIRCGNLNQCSFAFTVPNEEGAQRWSKKDGVMYREVFKINELFDLSAVYRPAYDDTYISSRSAEAAEAERLLLEAEQRAAEEEEKKEEETEEPKEEPKEELKEEPEKEEEREEDKKEEEETPEEPKEEEKEPEKDEKEEERSSEINNTDKIENLSKIHMNKNFSLVKAIRSAMNHTAFDETTQSLMNQAQKEMRASGLNYEGQIQIPFETRDGEAAASMYPLTKPTDATQVGGEDFAGTGTNHDHLIEFTFQSMLKPMRENSVLFSCGAKVLSGLVGDVKVPELKAGNAFAGWAGEIEEADEYFAKFDSFTISPKRLTVVTAISKQMLQQDSIGVENAVRQDIMEAFANKLEATVFGNGAGDANTPKGILNGLTAANNTISNYKDLCELEAVPADSYNNFGNFKYILSPKAKAALKCMIKGTNNTGMVLEGDSVDGTPSQMTTFLKNKEFLYLDPTAIWICQWGGLDIVVDDITLAARGMVKLVLNMYVNVKYVRPTESIIYGTLA